MPNYTYSDLYNAINTNLHQKIGVLPSPRAFINQITREVNTDVDIEDTIRRTPLSPLLFTSIYDYTSPSDVKSNKYVDIRPVVLPRRGTFSWFDPQRFDLLKDVRQDIFTVENRDTTRILRIAGLGGTYTEIDSLESTDDWVAQGNASSLAVDSQRFYSGSASLRFSMSGGTTGGVTGTLTAMDLTDYIDVSSFFVGVYIPDATKVTSVDFRWGSDSSNYYSVTATTPTAGSIQNGFNIFRFNWQALTPTGNPDETAITYFRINITYDGTASTEYGVDFLILAIGRSIDLIYYSNNFWRSVTGTWKEQSTADDDVLNVDDDGFDLMVARGSYKAGLIVRENVDYQAYKQEYKEAKDAYRQKHPSKAKVMERIYMDVDDLESRGDSFSETIIHSS